MKKGWDPEVPSWRGGARSQILRWSSYSFSIFLRISRSGGANPHSTLTHLLSRIFLKRDPFFSPVPVLPDGTVHIACFFLISPGPLSQITVINAFVSGTFFPGFLPRLSGRYPIYFRIDRVWKRW